MQSHSQARACKLRGGELAGVLGRLMQPGITTFPQPPPRQYSPPLEARKVCGEKTPGEGQGRKEKGGGTQGEGAGEERHQKGHTEELKREKERQGMKTPSGCQSGVGWVGVRTKLWGQ